MRPSALLRDHRGASRRLAGALLLAALALAGVGPLVHACPHHVAVSDSADHQESRHGDGHQESRHGDGHQGPCTCIGLCHGSSLAPLPALSDATGRLVLQDLRAPSLPSRATTVPPLADAYILPYPNGPPGIG